MRKYFLNSLRVLRGPNVDLNYVLNLSSNVDVLDRPINIKGLLDPKLLELEAEDITFFGSVLVPGNRNRQID